MNKEVLRFIDRLYKDLYLDEQVLHHSSGNKYDKFNNIKEYLEKQEEIHNNVTGSGKHINLLKKLYYAKYVIKKEDIPESYYGLQEKIALERGYGHVVITEGQKKELQQEVIENQKTSLDVWIDYFLSEDAKVYPFWAKYWAFQGMLKLGKYDKEKGEFGRRTKDTTAPFVDLNREALAMSVDLLMKLLNKEEIEDKELADLVKNGSFGKIYSYVLINVLTNNKNITKRNSGKWVKYNRGSDYMPLVNSLKGYNTGWCTAGQTTAKNQLSIGDFYVYYTLDENNEYRVPRIAIRMENNEIAEIRGIAEHQNVEQEMESVVEEKLKGFPDREKYYKKVNDMKILTTIYQKNKSKQELTLEELIFLYEIHFEITGFGYRRDPRIQEIIKERNHVEDLNRVFKSTEKISKFLDLSFLTNAKGLIFPNEVEGLVLSGLTSAEGVVFPQKITHLNLGGLTTSKGLVLPSEINGPLNLSKLTDAKGLVLPSKVNGKLNLKKLIKAEGLVLPQEINGSLDLKNLISADGLVLPNNIKDLDLSKLISASGLTFPKTINGNLSLSSLTSAEDLLLPEEINGNLDLKNLISADGLVLPNNIKDLYLRKLTNASRIVFPKVIDGNLYLSSLKSAEGLVLPKKVSGTLDLRSLTTAQGVTMPEEINGTLDLRSLTDAEHLILPNNLNGSLFLMSLTKADGLVLPERVNGALGLHALVDATGLIMPEEINGVLNLSSLKSAEGLVLSKRINGTIHLNSLTSAKGLILPNRISGALQLSSLISAEDLVLPKRVSGTLDLRSLTKIEGLLLPEEINGALYLNSIYSTELVGVALPNSVAFIVFKDGCKKIEEIKQHESKSNSL